MGPTTNPPQLRRWLAAILIVILVAQVLPLPSTADNAEETGMFLGAEGRIYSTTVWTGEHAITIGGRDSDGNILRDVVSFDPSSGLNGTVIGNLSVELHSHAAVWNGSFVYIFGGVSTADRTEILRFNPTTNETKVVGNFSTPRRFSSAIWNGSYAFVFGGVQIDAGQRTYRREVVRFDPVTNGLDVVVNATTHGTLADHIHAGSSAVWDGTHAYLFGGKTCGADPNGNIECDEIVRFSPSDNNVTILNSSLPKPVSVTAAAWEGLAAYIFGNETKTDEIIRYRPATDEATTMSAKLPEIRRATNSFWNGTEAYVLTGDDPEVIYPESIFRYELQPGPPTFFVTRSEPGPPVEVELEWDPPADNTYTDPIDNYKIYRRIQGQAVPPELIATLDGTARSYTDQDVEEGTAYCYRVAAVNVRGEGPPTDRSCLQAQ